MNKQQLANKEKDEREAVALDKANAPSVKDAISDPKRSKIFYDYMQ